MPAPQPAPGQIGWIDLTVEDAESLRDFYADVVGWIPEPVSMGDYDDYNMTDPSSSVPRAGVCHRRGDNADLPSTWLAYFVVADLDVSVKAVEKLGGKVIAGPRGGMGRYVVIEDPAGAVCALFEPAVAEAQ